jgi:hypothetical protein
MHIRFHVERFRFLRRDRGPVRRTVKDTLWRLFFAATRLAVWVKHRRALRLGARSFGRFWSEADRSFRQTLAAING